MTLETVLKSLLSLLSRWDATGFVRATWKILLVAVSILFVLLVLVVSKARPAHAQGVPCAPYKQMAAGLLKKYAEQPVGEGLAGDGRQRLVIFSSPGGATYSILLVGLDGTSCLVAAGKDFSIAPPRPANEKEA
jgi:hypothetical protein